MNLGIDVRWLHEAMANASSFSVDDDLLPLEGETSPFGNLGGVGRYLQELLPRLARRLPEARCVLGVLQGREVPEALTALWPAARTVGLTPRWRPAGPALGLLARVASARAELATRAVVAPLSLDVFFSPQQLVVPSGAWARHSVVACHDLAFLQFPHLFFPSGRLPPSYRAHYARLARAEHHIAVSERTAMALAAELGVPRDLITVTPEGVNPSFTMHGPALEPGWTYALCVGSAGPGKNMPVVLEGWRRACTRHSPVHLVMVGASRARVRELIASLPGDEAASVHRAAPGSDEQLALLYRGASMLLIPSLVEGFGLPALEAMACGCPVITSRETPMADMAGCAAMVVDPDSPDEIASAMVRLLEDAALRVDMRHRGARVASAYTWERTADLTASIIRQMAARPARFKSPASPPAPPRNPA